MYSCCILYAHNKQEQSFPASATIILISALCRPIRLAAWVYTSGKRLPGSGRDVTGGWRRSACCRRVGQRAGCGVHVRMYASATGGAVTAVAGGWNGLLLNGCSTESADQMDGAELRKQAFVNFRNFYAPEHHRKANSERKSRHAPRRSSKDSLQENENAYFTNFILNF